MSYTPTQWETGDIVTAEKLNKLEAGVAGSADGSIYQADKIEMPGNTGTAGGNSIVIPDPAHGANANGAASVHIGVGYSVNRSSNIHVGQRGTASANIRARYPWLVEYLDANGYFTTHTDGSACLNVGPNQIRNGASAGGVSVGTLNLHKPAQAGWPSFAFGLYNFCKGTAQFLLGVGLQGNTGQVFMCGRDADAGEDDRFVVGNGTVSGATRTPSTAFRVTKDGDAIAQTTLGIMDGNTLVSISASELSTLKTLAATGGSGALFVNMTENGYTFTLDKTWKEIDDALADGTPAFITSYVNDEEGTSRTVFLVEETGTVEGEYFVAADILHERRTFETDSENGYPSLEFNPEPTP